MVLQRSKNAQFHTIVADVRLPNMVFTRTVRIVFHFRALSNAVQHHDANVAVHFALTVGPRQSNPGRDHSTIAAQKWPSSLVHRENREYSEDIASPKTSWRAQFLSVCRQLPTCLTQVCIHNTLSFRHRMAIIVVSESSSLAPSEILSRF